jgi:hypothetical protein
MVTRFQQQLEEFGKLLIEQATKEESQIEENWKQLKEVIKEAAEQTIGYQPKPDRRGWFDDECRRALEEKNAAYIRNGLLDQPELRDWNTQDCGKYPITHVKTGKEHIWTIA